MAAIDTPLATNGDDGLATVFVNWIDEEEDVWSGVWQKGPTEHRDITGTKAQVLEWAKRQPADSRLIFNATRGYVPLE